MATCLICGKALDGGLTFCNHCGTPVAEEKSASVRASDPFEAGVKDAPAYGVVNLEELPEGHVIDHRYEVKGKLGQGRFGAVYHVFDRKMRCDKALKVLSDAVASDLEAMENIGNEAATMARLNHPGIVHVYDFCDTGRVKYIAMEFVAGESLSDALIDAPEGTLGESRVRDIARQLAEGLLYAHGQGVIHKDLKPQNILIGADGVPKITNFGIPETVKSSVRRTANASSSGPLAYMAPEQNRGRDVRRESDLSSFGALLYELLASHPSFYKGAIEHQALNEAVPPLKGRLVPRCLEKECTRRFQDSRGVLQALAEDGVPEKAISPSPHDSIRSKTPQPAQEKKSPMSRGLTWAVGALCAVTIAISGVLVLGRDDGGGEVGPARVSVAAPNSYEVSQTLARLEQRDEAARKVPEAPEAPYDKLRREIDAYEALIATEEGKSLKEAAWNELVGKFPDEARGVTAYDTEALLYGGRLTVRATPEGAMVRVLNIGPAYTPGIKLKPGTYEVEVAHEGYEASGKSVHLSRAEEKEVAVVLLKAMATLTLETVPAGAQITMKGTTATYSPGVTLKPGSYTAVVSADHHVSQERDIRLAAGETKRETVALVSFGSLTVNPSPAGASVVLMGSKETYRPGVRLAPGEYGLLVKAKGYFSKEERVGLVAGKTTSVMISLQNETFTNSLGMEFAYIKPGTFMMGSPSEEPGRDSDETQHCVSLNHGYYLQKTEVTQGQWKAVMGSNPSRFLNCGDNCPVEEVSWEDAQRFIQRLNAREGGSHYRLPTEAEWEAACRAGSDTPYANGMNLSSLGRYSDNSGLETHPVAQKASNAWGLYDMHGNVYEWCQDWYGSYPSGNVADPVGPSSGSYRVKRGGSWYYYAPYCRSANRSNYSPGTRYSYLGLRLARTP